MAERGIVTRDTASGRACLRLGPVDARSLLVCWPNDAPSAAGLLGGGSAVSGTLMASDGRAPDPRVLEIADVIFIADDAARTGPAEWLSRTLSRYPGCEVAAISHQHGDCTAATRDGWVRTLSLYGRQEASVCAFACAAFVHSWLAARLPLASFQPPRLEIGGSEVFAMPRSDATAGRPLHFRFRYAGRSGAACAGDPSVAAISDSRSRTELASGAPSFT